VFLWVYKEYSIQVWKRSHRINLSGAANIHTNCDQASVCAKTGEGPRLGIALRRLHNCSCSVERTGAKHGSLNPASDQRARLTWCTVPSISTGTMKSALLTGYNDTTGMRNTITAGLHHWWLEANPSDSLRRLNAFRDNCIVPWKNCGPEFHPSL